MSSVPPSILPDTRALRAVFDADFQSLVTQARGHLGEAASLAPRVAEGSLVRAWDARARLQTAAQLKAFLADDLKKAADRALARRAAGQKTGSGHATPAGEKSAGQVDLAQSWAFILDAIHVDPHSAQEQKQVAEAARHEAAESVTYATKVGIPLRMVLTIGAVIVIAALGVEMLVSNISTERVIAEVIASPHGKVTASPFGKMGNVTLGDGTKAQLAPDSKLFVPQEFAGKVRVVKLDGAASFDVAAGQPGTFRVYLRNAILVTKAAKFTVSGYYTDSTATVKVTDGSVEVRVGAQSTEVPSGQAFLVDSADKTRVPSSDEVDEAAAWADGKLVIPNRPLREAISLLQRWYSLDVNVQDIKLLDRPVTVHAPVDSSAPAIRGIEQSAGLKLNNDGKTMIFRDTTTAKGKAGGKN